MFLSQGCTCVWCIVLGVYHTNSMSVCSHHRVAQAFGASFWVPMEVVKEKLMIQVCFRLPIPVVTPCLHYIPVVTTCLPWRTFPPWIRRVIFTQHLERRALGCKTHLKITIVGASLTTLRNAIMVDLFVWRITEPNK